MANRPPVQGSRTCKNLYLGLVFAQQGGTLNRALAAADNGHLLSSKDAKVVEVRSVIDMARRQGGKCRGPEREGLHANRDDETSGSEFRSVLRADRKGIVGP